MLSIQWKNNKPRTIFQENGSSKRTAQKMVWGKKGFLTVEILIVTTIIVIAFVAILGLIVFSLSTSMFIEHSTQANNIAQETIEATKNFRDGTQWDTDGIGMLTMGISYYPQKYGSPSKWQLVAGEETIGIFTRKVVFENAIRDGSDNIIDGAGTSDPDTKKMISTVSWQEKVKTRKVEIVTYVTNWIQ